MSGEVCFECGADVGAPNETDGIGARPVTERPTASDYAAIDREFVELGMQRPCINCIHYDDQPRSGRSVDTCMNRAVRWHIPKGQPTIDNALCDEARSRNGRCGEAGVFWEPKP